MLRPDLASTCHWMRYPEVAGLSGASASSGKAFTLDSPRARGIIFTQVEALKIIRQKIPVKPPKAVVPWAFKEASLLYEA